MPLAWLDPAARLLMALHELGAGRGAGAASGHAWPRCGRADGGAGLRCAALPMAPRLRCRPSVWTAGARSASDSRPACPTSGPTAAGPAGRCPGRRWRLSSMPLFIVASRMLLISSRMNSDSNCLAASLMLPLALFAGLRQSLQLVQRPDVGGQAVGQGLRGQPCQITSSSAFSAPAALMACRMASRSCGVAPSELSARTTSASCGRRPSASGCRVPA
jgi:hypothetical protein